MIAILDPLDRLTVFKYDEQDRRTAKYMPFVAANPGGIADPCDIYNELADASPQPKCESSEYDDFGRIVKTTDYKGQVTGYLYDNQGRLEYQKFYDSNSIYPNDPNETIQYVYDNLGRKTQVSVNDYDNSTVSTYGYDYDDQGRVVEVNTPQGTIGYDYNDVTSRMESVYTPSLGTADSLINYGYDDLGRLETATVDKRNGQSVTEVSMYQYSPVGSRQSLEYANNNYTEYEYDALNRLKGLTNWQDDIESTALSSFQYTLAADGTRTKVVETVDETRTIEYTYDNLNRLIQEYAFVGTNESTADHKYTIDYTYDLAGNRIQRIVDVYHSGPGWDDVKSTYTYNPNTDRLLEEKHVGPELVAFYWNDKQVYAHAGGGRFNKYHIAGQDGDIGSLRAWLLGMPTRWSQYLFRLIALLLPLVFLSPAFRRIIHRGERRVRRVKPLLRQGLILLIAYVMFISPEAFQQLSHADIAFSQLLTTDWASGNRTITYTYDDNGSVTSKITMETDTQAETERVIYEYNLQNRLKTVKVSTDGGSSWDSITEYKYDPDGNRVAKTVDGATTDHLVDSLNHTGYAQTFVEDEGTNTTCYIIANDVLAQAVNSDNPQYLLYDGHGSTRQLVASNGTAVNDSFSYDAYGVLLQDESVAQSNPGKTPIQATSLLYAGEHFDTDAQQYYLRARWYNPLSGLFNRTDSWSGSLQDPQSLHKYLYCHANPVNNLDLLGLSVIEFGGGYPYNIKRGLLVHAIFYAFAAAQGGFYDTPIGQLINKGLIHAGYALLRPDAVIRKGSKAGFYELKPITHLKRRALAVATAAQMRLYDFGFACSGIGRGNSSLFLGNVPFMTGVPGGYIYDGSVWEVTFYASDKTAPVFGDGRGIIYYSLKTVNKNWRKRKKMPRLIQQLGHVPASVKENILLPSLAVLTVGESDLAIRQGVVLSAAYTAAGVSMVVIYKVYQGQLGFI